MPIDSAEIVMRLCRAAARNQFPLGAVRAQKLVYLIECEYYRWNQSRLTDEEWIYYHYGPWSPTLAHLLSARFAIDPEVLEDGREFKGIRYEESEFYRLPERFSDFELQGIFERVVEQWFTRPLSELLNFVYFRTPPMKDAQRGQPLNFGAIASARGERDPIDVQRLALRNQLGSEKVKRALAAWRKSIADRRPAAVPWDDDAALATREMNAREDTPPIRGRIVITGEDARWLPGEDEG